MFRIGSRVGRNVWVSAPLLPGCGCLTALLVLALLVGGAVQLFGQSSEQDSVHIAYRLNWARGLILDTLVPLAERSPREVQVMSLPGRRGDYRAFERLTVKDPNDGFALLHEFGHHFAASQPREYFDWADFFKLDPWKRTSQEAFADAFAGAVMLLQRTHGGQDLPPQPSRKPSREEFLARRLRSRRPFRRRDDSIADSIVPDFD